MCRYFVIVYIVLTLVLQDFNKRNELVKCLQILINSTSTTVNSHFNSNVTVTTSAHVQWLTICPYSVTALSVLLEMLIDINELKRRLRAGNSPRGRTASINRGRHTAMVVALSPPTLRRCPSLAD